MLVQKHSRLRWRSGTPAAFILVAIVRPFVPRLRQSPWFGALLDGVNVVSLALVFGWFQSLYNAFIERVG